MTTLRFSREPLHITIATELRRRSMRMSAPKCTSIIITTDLRRLEPTERGIRLLARGRDAGLADDPDIAVRPLLSGDHGAVVVVLGTTVAIVVEPGGGKRLQQRRIVATASLIARLAPTTIVLSAPSLWEAPSFETRLAPAILKHADRVVAGRRVLDFSDPRGRGAWHLLVALLASRHTEAIAHQMQTPSRSRDVAA